MAQPAPSSEQAITPRHVAIIMDGNGRWARQRNRPRTFGHAEGVEALRRTVEAAGELGVEYLTVFGFSTENWRRPVEEVNALFDLLRLYVARDLDKLMREGVRVRVIGGREGLQRDIAGIIESAEARTRNNTKLNLTIAFNYGGQDEIVRAARRVAADVAAGKLNSADLDSGKFESYLDTQDLPAADLLVRTSGEFRLSNFMLWQSAYAELVFLDVLWPDFGKDALSQAIEIYRGRERRYGGTAPESA
ncbi:isoprenyl transferase [Candidatus Viadribacter manganicus]|uniref:Isoprenyl transferase n=1 Tax=Candidatus Viadribacter manganicus TaxID=1759059 RepID=A0A1B1ADC5_9PROT|nr:isoprenyl transferase [Candidatus Viadribacter manganicus]ANP44555.1 UDP pyrophosphate synthase [Candidatus Viadribacter manganicus]